MSRAVIFDLDGTLADTSHDLVAAINAALGVLWFPVKFDAATRGGEAMQIGGRGMFNHAYAEMGVSPSAAEKESHYQVLIEEYSKAPCVHSRLYSGSAAALGRLNARAARIGLCTNKPSRQVGPVLRGLEIADHFQAVIAADTLPVRKPDPEPLIETANRLGADVKQSVLIGDSKTDAETARRAGSALILVGFGPLGADVAALDPDAILDHFDDLDQVLDDLWGKGAR